MNIYIYIAILSVYTVESSLLVGIYIFVDFMGYQYYNVANLHSHKRITFMCYNATNYLSRHKIMSPRTHNSLMIHVHLGTK